jgi:hypothetical protein
MRLVRLSGRADPAWQAGPRSLPELARSSLADRARSLPQRRSGAFFQSKEGKRLYLRFAVPKLQQFGPQV